MCGKEDGVAVAVITHDLKIMKIADRLEVHYMGASIEELRWKGVALTGLVDGGEVG